MLPSFTVVNKHTMVKQVLTLTQSYLQLKFDSTLLQAFSLTAQQSAWHQIQPIADLGQDCGTYKWTQSQTEVDVFVRVPSQIRRHEVGAVIVVDSLPLFDR